jgi:L-alanine-DL-glutamate epimerase-like enolase superfamily enzyme
MRITGIDGYVLLQPDFDATATSSAQDDFVVEIRTDEGVSGIGESDVNPWIARACLDAPGTHTMGQGVRDLLIGMDPLAIETIWDRLYIGTAMNGRRGAVIHVLGAIEMALQDLRGKALGQPCHMLLGGARATHIIPYASLQPEVSGFAAYRDSLVAWALRAKELGFRAVKTEVTLSGPYAHKGLSESWDRATEVVSAVRSALGPEVVLMVDVQYAFPDVETAIRVLREWEAFNLYFVEAPLWPDDLEGYRQLVQEQPVPVATGEWLATRWEFAELIGRARPQVVQPDIGRVGGMTEALHVCDLAHDHGLRVVPHLWKTGISIAAAAHLAAARPEVAFIEYLPADLCESGLRKDLVDDGLQMVNGQIALPQKPGLGIELDRGALECYRQA